MALRHCSSAPPCLCAKRGKPEEKYEGNRSQRREKAAEKKERHDRREVEKATKEQVGEVKSSARHLGGQLSWNACSKSELDTRLGAVVGRWKEMGDFWFAAIPKIIKKKVFQANVIGAALSGITSYVLSSRKQS